MLAATELLERLARDLRITRKNLSPSLIGNIESILGPSEEWDLDRHSRSEHAYIYRLIQEERRTLRLSSLRSRRAAWKAIRGIDRLRATLLPVPLFPDPPRSLRSNGHRAFPEEAWFFVNGIATNKEILRLNGRYLSLLFGRPIELIYNPTLGPLRDLLECMTGRTFDFASAPAEYALERVSAALSDRDTERVVLMGHSQGGIIVSNVVSGIIDRFGGDAERMAKLEVYTFASACDEMPIDEPLSRNRKVPHIEHFANTEDLVAKLGVLERRLKIPGRVFVLKRRGHLLNAHYLPEIETKERYAWYDLRERRPRQPHYDARLFEYLRRGKPELLPI